MGDPHAVTPSPEVLTATSTAVPFPSAALRTTIRHGPPEQAAALQEADGTTVTVHSHYRLAGLLGEGGQGRVYAAEHAFLGREVAIKICSQAEGSVPARFRNEARLTAMLSHRSIIPIYDAADGVLVMRRLRGTTLEERIRDGRGPEALPALIEMLVDVCQAVAYAHDRGVIHRDLKAANVIVGDYGEVTVIDWGLAVPLEDGHLPRCIDGQEVPICAGTPACLPPECLGSDPARVGTASDVFLLGGILYHILAGRMPYQHTSTLEAMLAAARSVQVVPVERIAADAPAKLIAVQRQAMDPEPARRPSVAAFQQALHAWLRQSGNLPAALQALDLARLLVRRARVCSRRETELRTDCYIQALAHYDRALALVDDLPGVASERERALTDFIRACVLSGEITLARLLERHRRLPVLAQHAASDTASSSRTSTRRHAHRS